MVLNTLVYWIVGIGLAFLAIMFPKWRRELSVGKEVDQLEAITDEPPISKTVLYRLYRDLIAHFEENALAYYLQQAPGMTDKLLDYIKKKFGDVQGMPTVGLTILLNKGHATDEIRKCAEHLLGKSLPKGPLTMVVQDHYLKIAKEEANRLSVSGDLQKEMECDPGECRGPMDDS